MLSTITDMFQRFPKLERHMPAAILVFLLLNSMPAFSEHTFSIFSVKGFGTLAGTGTDTNEIGFRRDIANEKGATKSWDVLTDSRLGVQIDAKLNESVTGTFQWVARERTGDFFEQNLDLAFLRWSPLPDLDVRIGRVSADSFMLSDHRNVGYAYLWMRPPHEFYGNIPFYHYDGIDITKKFEINGGYLSFKVFGGYSYSQLKILGSEVFDQEAVIFTGSAVYEKGDWRTRLGYSHIDLTSSPKSIKDIVKAINNPTINVAWPGINQLQSRFETAGKVVNFSDIGVSYDDGTWLAQAEASYIGSNLQFFPDLANGYISLGRRVSSVTLYTLLGISKSFDTKVKVSAPRIPNPQLLGLQQSFDRLLNNNGIDEKSVSLGLRWDFYTNMAFKAQWSHFWLGANGTQTWVENPQLSSPKEANVFSVGVDFLF